MGNFENAVKKFLKEATWLEDIDLPMVVSLQEAALELDTNGVAPALLNTFGVTYRALLKRRAGDDGAVSEAEAFLSGLD